MSFMRKPWIAACAALAAAAIVAYVLTTSRTPDVVLALEFEPGFRGRFSVIDAGHFDGSDREDLVIRVPASGVASGPIAQVNVRDTIARFTNGEKLPAHAFFYHHVPPDPVAVWVYGMRQFKGKPWEQGGFVGSFSEASSDYRAWVEPR